MKKEWQVPDFSKEIDLKCAKISRRHALRLLVTLGIGGTLAWASFAQQNSDEATVDSQLQELAK